MWSATPNFGKQETDLVLNIDSRQFHVHKDILIKSSDYFQAMFLVEMAEKDQKTVTLKEIEPDVFELLLTGFYTGVLPLDETNIFSVTELAGMLQASEELKSQCSQFLLDNLINIDSCLEVLSFSRQFMIPEVREAAMRFCLGHFTTIRQHSSFLELSVEDLTTYLSQKNLIVNHEIEVFESVCKWFAEYRKDDNDLQVLKDILDKCVFLKEMDENVLIAAQDYILGFLKEIPKDMFTSRPRQQDLLLFWSVLSSTEANGLVDIVRLCPETSAGILHDKMTAIVEEPGFELGSALCTLGPYVYLCGGGPGFGKVNWIHHVWRFDNFSPRGQRWAKVGKLFETRRYHAMAGVGNSLYIFGGFGKFRVRNSKLHRFDLSEESWQELPPMPVHEIDPVTATLDDCFMYIDTSWQPHSFNTVSKQWTSFPTEGLMKSLICLQPRAAHFLPRDEHHELIVISGHLKFSCFHLDSSTGVCLHQKTMEFELDEGVFHSASMFDRIAVVLKQESIFSENNSSQASEVMSFSNLDCGLQNWFTFTNVEKFQSILAVPHV